MRSLSFAIISLVAAASFFSGGAFGQSRRGGAGDGPVIKSVRPTPTATPTAASAEPETTDDSGEIITVETKLISIPTRVLDRSGRFVSGLKKENFSIFEDNVEKPVEYFSNEQQPFTVALVLDMSYSATFKISEIHNAAITFVSQLRPNDRVIVISFDQDVNVLCEPTNDRKKIIAAIRSTKISTGTSLFEAVDETLNRQLSRIDGRKAVVLFTDGVDTTSRTANDRSTINDAAEFDALIYPIRYDTYADVQRMKSGSRGISVPLPGTTSPMPGGLPPSGVPPIALPGPTGGTMPLPVPGVMGSPSDKGTSKDEYERAAEYLDELAVRTGGRVHLAAGYDGLTKAFAKIASELREFYSLGYTPDDDAAGKVRRIKVKVDVPNVAVRARDSYIIASKDEQTRSGKR